MALSQVLTDLCQTNDFRLLEKKQQATHVQLVLSLRPNQRISDVLKQLKGRSSAALCRDFGISPPLWARGYLARSVGNVGVQAVRRYLDAQAEHHGYGNRSLPPVFRYKPVELRSL